MTIASSPTVLSLFLSPAEAYFYDRAGRLFAAWEKGWFIRVGLSGRCSARRWKDGRRDIRPLTPVEIEQVENNGRRALAGAAAGASDDAASWMALALRRQPVSDTLHFRSVYRPIGILPPDQYGACVVQVTEGCGWNQCHFCSFYRGQPYRPKNRKQMRTHLEAIAAFFGEGLSLRRTIFLGEANAMGAPLEDLVYAMEEAARTLVPRMPDFRGYFSFHEGTESSRHSLADFRVLAALGLKRVYVGLETGHPELRARLRKPGPLESIAESIANAKRAGVRTALIALVGAGGPAWAARHRNDTLRFIRSLALESSDFVYLSPLYGPDGTTEEPMTSTQMDAEMSSWRASLAGQVRAVPYDIREFVY